MTAEARDVGDRDTVECDQCEEGFVEREVVDANESGLVFDAINGGSSELIQPFLELENGGVQFTVRNWYCPSCTAGKGEA